MNQFIPHDVFLKIKQAQENTLNKIRSEVNSEISYISQKFISELSQNLESLISDPFNIYLKIPRNNNCNSKLYLDELSKSYFQSFHHEMQLVNGFFYVLLKHNGLIPVEDPRPKQMISEKEPEPVEEEVVFNDTEKKKFELREQILQKKDILVPLFLQRRNSRLSLPSFSARKTHSEPVSVSDNPEESEAN